ncbi:MAG: hypothetical protein QGF38_13680 [Rhodospirillales bacterium]|jgi:hypothetical protein|nr:hypothetical protein [Rhodospirillales bacterium]MDP7652742.1 hypothetical protein [Rhodospirillales bacterium]HJO97453.1 hypothetical protein [Rhodospirillales bacterium]
MTDQSAGPKTDTKTKSDTTTKSDTKTKSDTTTKTKDKKSGGTPDKKAEKIESKVATHEGQKPVTDEYRANWNRIFGGKS